MVIPELAQELHVWTDKSCKEPLLLFYIQLYESVLLDELITSYVGRKGGEAEVVKDTSLQPDILQNSRI